MHPSSATSVAELESANDRLKRQFSAWFWASMAIATGVHFGTFALWPELTAADFSIVSDAPIVIDLPPEVDVPPPPEDVVRPAKPTVGAADIDEEITIGLTSFKDNPIDRLPPPPEERASDTSLTPTLTPYTVGPEILNRREVQRAMERLYPPTLRDVGIGGTVEVYFYIDESGVVRQTRINKSSGHSALDGAALAVSDVFRFSPALNRDNHVSVWVSFPIVFQVRDSAPY